MIGEIDVKLRGGAYLFGYRYWPDDEIELIYGYANGNCIGKHSLHLIEIGYQELLKSQITAQILERGTASENNN